MKHKLSAILMAFMLTTPAAFAAPEAANEAEATTGTTGTTTTTTSATTDGCYHWWHRCAVGSGTLLVPDGALVWKRRQ